MTDIKVNSNWDFEEVETPTPLFAVIYKHKLDKEGYVDFYSEDEDIATYNFEKLCDYYIDINASEDSIVYLVQLPNTDEITEKLDKADLFSEMSNSESIEIVTELLQHRDCVILVEWQNDEELIEAKKKKRKKRKTPRVTYTMGWPWYNDHRFNHHNGTCDCNKDKDEAGEDAADNANDAISGGESVGDAGSAGGNFGGDVGGDSAGGEGGAMGESLNEAKEESLEDKIRSIIAHKETDDWHDGKAYLFEVSDASKESNNGEVDPFWIKKFDDGEVDFSELKVYDRTPEEIEDGKYVATFMLSGGKNGSGKWTDYLGQLTDVFKALKEKTGTEPLLYKLDTDICDDVWTGYVFLYNHDDTVKESLKEAVDYWDQIPKMKALNDGTRGFNAKASSDEKLRVNRQVCIDHNYTKALAIVEAEMNARGILPQSTKKIHTYEVPAGYSVSIADFNTADFIFLKDHKYESNIIINNIVSAGEQNAATFAIICLIFAVVAQYHSVISAIKNWILSHTNVDLTQLKQIIADCSKNEEIIKAIDNIIKN